MNTITIGSLFDGIGGFTYAAIQHGIYPIWASEIDKTCIGITKRHFPYMQHLGDIARIDGAQIPPVDIISFGSPCQDLSIAGERKGLGGERSGLFMDAVRIIHEMRAATNGKNPKYAIWENVTGALSSAKGHDFRAVLSEITQTYIPMPKSGRWASAGMVRGQGISVAWRVLDAQYWGVPQRRRRIFAVVDFRDERAGEILFKRESLSGDIATCGKAWEGSSTYAAACVGNEKPVLAHPQVIGTLCASGAGLSRPAGMGSETDLCVVLLCQKTGNTIVRRLTPLECERLQGFPDVWTKYDHDGCTISDTARYRMLGNSVATPCVAHVLHGIKEEMDIRAILYGE